MPHSLVGLGLDALETPALVLDLDALETNIHQIGSTIIGRGKHWRPHAKAFKCPAIGHKLLQAGAIGLTVAKVSEAEVFAAAGIRDLLIAHLVVGPSRAARLAAIQHLADVKATVDHADQIEPLSHAAVEAGVTIGLLVDMDIGLGRTGVPHPEAAARLAEQVAQAPGLRFDGLMGYEGHTLTIPDAGTKHEAIKRSIDRLIDGLNAVEKAGLTCRIVSAGGSGSYPITSSLPGVTELQAGGGIFGCNYYRNACSITELVPALFVLASVVSRPSPDRAILNLGRKSISDHLVPPTLPDFPDCTVAGLSAEHGTVRLSPENPSLRIADRVRVIPGYSDLTFVLHNEITAFRRNRIEAHWPLLARGMLQ